MKTTVKYYSYSTSALENASYWRARETKSATTVTRYVNGDYVGDVKDIPAGLIAFDAATARKHLPKGYK